MTHRSHCKSRFTEFDMKSYGSHNCSLQPKNVLLHRILQQAQLSTTSPSAFEFIHHAITTSASKSVICFNFGVGLSRRPRKIIPLGLCMGTKGTRTYLERISVYIKNSGQYLIECAK